MGDVLVRSARPNDKDTIKQWHSYLHGDNLQYPENWNPYNPRKSIPKIENPFRDGNFNGDEDDEDEDSEDFSHFDDLWETWLTDEYSQMYVAEMFGMPIALARVVQLSDIEVWWENIEEDPPHKGQGLFRTFQYHIGKDLERQGIILSRMGVSSNSTLTKQLEENGIKPVAAFAKFQSRNILESRRSPKQHDVHETELEKSMDKLLIEDMDDPRSEDEDGLKNEATTTTDFEGGQNAEAVQELEKERVEADLDEDGSKEEPERSRSVWTEPESLNGTFLQLTPNHLGAAWDFISENEYFEVAFSNLYRSVERCFQELTDMQLQLCIEEGRVFAYIIPRDDELFIESLSIVDDDADCWISMFLPSAQETEKHFDTLPELARILGHHTIAGQFPTACEQYVQAMDESRLNLVPSKDNFEILIYEWQNEKQRPPVQ